MVRRCSDKMAKMLMVIFNAVFLICGIAIVWIGFSDFKRIGHIEEIVQNFKGVNIGFLVVGFAICFIAFLGCCGALTESGCMITSFLLIMLVILISEITVGAIAFNRREDIGNIIKDKAYESLGQYKKSEILEVAWDDVQTSLRCCGAKSASDYADYNLTIPDSCCKPKAEYTKCSKDQAYQENCIHAMGEYLKGHLLSIGVAALIIGFIEVVGIIFACCLRSAINEQYQTV